jgi:hypothetical protein
MMIMRRNKPEEKMKNKEPFNLTRILSVIAIFLVTFLVVSFWCMQSHLYLDESLCILFVTCMFLLVYLFEMEYDRRCQHIAHNAQTNFVRLAIVYVVCCLLTWGMTFLPEFCYPVMLVPILVCAVSNPLMGMTVGLFFSVLLALMAGSSFYALACYTILTVLGAALAQALTEKRYRGFLSLMFLFLQVMAPNLFLYLAQKELRKETLIVSVADGVVTAFAGYFLYGWLCRKAEDEVDNLYLDIVSEDYSQVQALRDFSMVEYRHAGQVSELAYRCAKRMGYQEKLCLAAGFYYRMGQWIGEPYIKSGVERAKKLCFPTALVNILAEYQGQEQLPSTPESALIHMIDALVVRLEAVDSSVSDSQWNSEIFIYQTLNEFSASGIYDQSGMSMNQFLKVREILAKEELVH